MISTGGNHGDTQTALFYIFDLVTLYWTNSYHPMLPPYILPAEIFNVIGGRFEGSHFRQSALLLLTLCDVQFLWECNKKRTN